MGMAMTAEDFAYQQSTPLHNSQRLTRSTGQMTSGDPVTGEWGYEFPTETARQAGYENSAGNIGGQAALPRHPKFRILPHFRENQGDVQVRSNLFNAEYCYRYISIHLKG
jgi:hypothetical protein